MTRIPEEVSTRMSRARRDRRASSAAGRAGAECPAMTRSGLPRIAGIALVLAGVALTRRRTEPATDEPPAG
jgi:hypothetical protein